MVRLPQSWVAVSASAWKRVRTSKKATIRLMPKAPPSWRMKLATPAPWRTLSGGSAFSAVALRLGLMKPRPKTPIAEPRRSAGKTVKMVAITSGWAMPALKPCRMRARISESSVGAVPPSTAPRENEQSAVTNTRRSPKMPVSQALISMPAVIVAM